MSHSIVQGDFIGSDLGLRTPLYAQAIAPIFTSSEQEQLERLRGVCLPSLAVGLTSSRDCRSLLSKSTTSSAISVFRGSLTLEQTRFNSTVQFPNTFFLQSVDARGVIFNKKTNWTETRFSRIVTFANAIFREQNQFQSSIFFDKADFKEAEFQETAYFQDSTFEDAAYFTQANFQQLAKFTRVQWRGSTDFRQVPFANQAQFTKAIFYQFLCLAEATFAQDVSFREVQFNQPVNLQGVSILKQANFSDAGFTKEAYLNVSGLNFDSTQAKILGNPGKIGQKLVVKMQGNQNVLRNLAQNFRQLQQIADANRLEYIKQKLRRQELSLLLVGTNINSASQKRLKDVGFGTAQALAIARRRQIQPFGNIRELLTLADIDLETYTQIRPRIIFTEDGTMRQLRLLIGRLPLIPRCQVFRVLLYPTHHSALASPQLRSWTIRSVFLYQGMVNISKIALSNSCPKIILARRPRESITIALRLKL